jgi:predicted secreted protein
MYTRFEIRDKENPNKTYGFLIGLSKIGIDEKEVDNLTEHLDEYLEVPFYYYSVGKKKQKNVFAYFTDLGLKRFEADIENICNVIKEKGYEVIVLKQNNVGTARLMYEDKYQALIRR